MNICKLTELAQRWLSAKQRETDAAADRRTIEDEIDNEIDDAAPDEGAATIADVPGLKITITRKTQRKITNMSQAAQLIGSWPLDISDGLIEKKYDIPESRLKWLQTNLPEYYQRLAPVLESKPAKTAITIKQETPRK